MQCRHQCFHPISIGRLNAALYLVYIYVCVYISINIKWDLKFQPISSAGYLQALMQHKFPSQYKRKETQKLFN